MTWDRHRPLTPDQRTHTAALLRATADQLEADHAAQVQANIGHAADPSWPASTFGGGGGHGGSPVEQTLLKLAERTGPDAQARALLASQHHAIDVVGRWLDQLIAWSPARTIARCPNPGCNAPLRPDRRCPECGTREGAERCCDDCGDGGGRQGLRPWPTVTWAGWTDGQARMLCLRDWMWRYRHDGRPRNGIERLQLGDGLITEAKIVDVALTDNGLGSIAERCDSGPDQR